MIGFMLKLGVSITEKLSSPAFDNSKVQCETESLLTFAAPCSLLL